MQTAAHETESNFRFVIRDCYSGSRGNHDTFHDSRFTIHDLRLRCVLCAVWRESRICVIARFVFALAAQSCVRCGTHGFTHYYYQHVWCKYIQYSRTASSAHLPITQIEAGTVEDRRWQLRDLGLCV